jgi:ADP-ribosylglycohydrolase
MALYGSTKLQIKAYVEEHFGHMLDMTVEELRLMPKTTIRCNVTAPQALICFMESTDYESAIRNAVYTKGDTDTIAAIAGSIAEAFYGVHSIPQEMIDGAKQRLTPEMIELINQFYHKIGEYNESYKDFII